MGLGNDIPWREVFSPFGRNSRSRFWVVAFCCAITSAMLRLLVITIGDSTLALALTPFFLAVFVAGIINVIKRLHDIGRSGWWLLSWVAIGVLLGLVARRSGGAIADLATDGSYLIEVVLLLVIGFWPGKMGPNRFGPQPGVSAAEVFN